MTDEPALKLEVLDVLCPRHGEPFRADWPHGYAQASTSLLKIFSGSMEVMSYTRGDLHNLTEAVAEFGPLCCFAGDGKMVSIYKRTGIGTMALCQVCRAPRRGTPYRVQEKEGVRTLKHVCFECVAASFSIPPPV